MFDKNKLKKIKLIVTDLDGTLLNNNGDIDDNSEELVFKLKSKGTDITFASGRLHSALTEYASTLNVKFPIISLDGCLIKSSSDGKVLFESFVPEKSVKKALDFADKFLLNIALCHADAIYYTEQNSVIPQIMDKFGAVYKEVDSYDKYINKTLEVVIASDFKENVKYVRDHMGFPYSFGLNTSYFKSQRHSGVYYLEIRKKGANKGKALQKLLKHLKVKQEETAVIGDWHNDISLFLPDTLKVTLENSVPELKKMADIVIHKNNNEGGAAEFLEMVYKAKRN